MPKFDPTQRILNARKLDFFNFILKKSIWHNLLNACAPFNKRMFVDQYYIGHGNIEILKKDILNQFYFQIRESFLIDDDDEQMIPWLLNLIEQFDNQKYHLSAKFFKAVYFLIEHIYKMIDFKAINNMHYSYSIAISLMNIQALTNRFLKDNPTFSIDFVPDDLNVTCLSEIYSSCKQSGYADALLKVSQIKTKYIDFYNIALKHQLSPFIRYLFFSSAAYTKEKNDRLLKIARCHCHPRWKVEYTKKQFNLITALFPMLKNVRGWENTYEVYPHIIQLAALFIVNSWSLEIYNPSRELPNLDSILDFLIMIKAQTFPDDDVCQINEDRNNIFLEEHRVAYP